MVNTKQNTFPALVWAISGTLVIVYACMGLIDTNILGIEYIVDYLFSMDNVYLYWALVLAIFIEGIYIVGNFFPGSSIVVILILGKSIQDIGIFFSSIALIFFAWSIAGAFNVFVALCIKKGFIKNYYIESINIESNKWISWFPSFRANYEVSQIFEGYSWKKVFIVSSKIKLIASFVLMIILYLLSFIIDINSINDREGFFSLFIIGVISLVIAFFKYKQGKKYA